MVWMQLLLPLLRKASRPTIFDWFVLLKFKMLNAVYLKVFQLGVVQMGVDWYSSVMKAAFWVLWIISTNKHILWKIKRLFFEKFPMSTLSTLQSVSLLLPSDPHIFQVKNCDWRFTARLISYKQVIHGNWMISVMAVLLTMLNYESICKISTKECCPITEPYFPQPLSRISTAEAGVCVVPSLRLEPPLPPPPPLLLCSSVQVHTKLFKEICKLEVKDIFTINGTRTCTIGMCFLLKSLKTLGIFLPLLFLLLLQARQCLPSSSYQLFQLHPSSSLLPFSAGKVLILKCVDCLNLWKRGDIWNQINYYRPVSVAHLPPPTSSCVTFLTQDQLPIFKQWGNSFDARQTSYFQAARQLRQL